MKRLALITVILGSALALVPFASAQVLSEAGGGGVGAVGGRDVASNVNPATQAIIVRSQGLASHYVDPATTAVVLRSKGLAGYYQTSGYTFHTDVLGGSGTSATPSVSSGDAFNWNTTLAVTLAGMLAIALAATMMTRRRHQHQPSF